MPAWLVDLLTRYGYAAVFGGVFLENTGLPVPGETTLLAGAALAHGGRLALGRVIVVAIVAAICGDSLGFLIGRSGGRVLAERHGWKIGLTPARLRLFDAFFHRYGAPTVFIARFVTGLRVFCAVVAGGSGLPWSTFLFYNASGAVVWASAVGAAGYLLAHSWATLERWIGRTGLVGLIIVLALAGWAATRQRQGAQE